MLVGITGCIGCGKSFILKQIENKGYLTYSSDEFVRMSYEDSSVLTKLDETFHCVFEGKLDKTVLKRQLTNENIKNLNQIIHPYVIMKIKEAKEASINNIIFIEVPLLFESKLSYLFDKTIAISCDDTLRHQRIYQRDPANYDYMLKLEKEQLDNDSKAALADYVLYSSNDDQSNAMQLDHILDFLKKGDTL